MIDIKRTVFLLDGQTEIQSFRDKFLKDFGIEPGFRRVGCNGKVVSARGYAKKAAPMISVCLNDRFSTVVSVVDRENRRVSAAGLAQQIRQALLKEVTSLRDEDLFVCVPDIMFENWIIADVEGIMQKGKLVYDKVVQEAYDGRNGARILDGMMSVKYKKTTHARMLFKLVRFLRAKSNSSSFKSFYDAVLA